MTTAQRIALMADWWPAACRTQGWDKSDRALRMNVLSRAVKRPITSANDLTHTGDVDAVKAFLKCAADDLQGAHETDHPEEGIERRLRAVIGDLTKCVGLYHANPSAYVAAIVRGKHNHGLKYSTRALEDLTEAELRQMLFTLTGRLAGMRKPTSETEHEMRQRAGVSCRSSCAACRKGKAKIEDGGLRMEVGVEVAASAELVGAGKEEQPF